MKSVDAMVEKTLNSAEGNAVFAAVWIVMVVVACLSALAIHEHELQLERAHASGVSTGATMCERGLR
ncbi:hypothetical protein D3C86_2132660 [compost metagenome]